MYIFSFLFLTGCPKKILQHLVFKMFWDKIQFVVTEILHLSVLRSSSIGGGFHLKFKDVLFTLAHPIRNRSMIEYQI